MANNQTTEGFSGDYRAANIPMEDYVARFAGEEHKAGGFGHKAAYDSVTAQLLMGRLYKSRAGHIKKAVKSTNSRSSALSGALARLKEDNAVLRRIFRPKMNFSYFDKNIGQFSVKTFRLTGHGTFKFEGTRTLSEKEAFAIMDKKNKKGKLLIFDENGRVLQGRGQLSPREIEMFNIVKQIKEGKIPAKAPEVNEAAIIPKSGNAIFESVGRISATMSCLKNRKQQQKSIPRL